MKDQIRADFEQEFPLPNGVAFDGDHYVADPAVIGSFQNATIWSHMFRGWKARSNMVINEIPEGFLMELGFDVLDRPFRFIESRSHVPTIKIILPACEVDDSSAWYSRDELASRITSIFGGGHAD